MANTCWAKIFKRFPNTLRTFCLAGMCGTMNAFFFCICKRCYMIVYRKTGFIASNIKTCYIGVFKLLYQ